MDWAALSWSGVKCKVVALATTTTNAFFSPFSMPSTPLLYWVLISVWCILQCQAANPVFFCKCFCGSNSTIFEVPVLDSKPCSNCTKQFCLDNVQDGLCDGIADETCPSNDFRTSCFGEYWITCYQKDTNDWHYFSAWFIQGWSHSMYFSGSHRWSGPLCCIKTLLQALALGMWKDDW